MSGFGNNLGKYLHPAGKRAAERAARREATEAATPDVQEPVGLGDQFKGRLKPGMFKLKPKSAPEQAEHDEQMEEDNAKNATRSTLIGTRG